MHIKSIFTLQNILQHYQIQQNVLKL